jgi:hypothetical protein
MKLKVGLIGSVAVTVMLQMGLAHAETPLPKLAVNAKNKADFIAVVAAVHKEMLPGGRYDLIDKKERNTVDSHLADMESMFDKHDTVDQMTPSEKIQLFNDQEVVNTTLTHRDNDRMICESVAPVGSHIPRTTCVTYGQKMQSERDKLHVMDQWKHHQTLLGGDGVPTNLRGGH